MWINPGIGIFANMKTGEKILCELVEQRNIEQARHLMRFFKTGEGEYGYGDKFLGLKVPQTRAVVRKWRNEVQLEDAIELTESEWHEVRLAGLLLLVELYQKAKRRKNEIECRKIVCRYTDVISRGNNWDLVDLVAPKILGDWLLNHEDERGILYKLASMDGYLWHQRVAIVSCWTLIRDGQYSDTFKLTTRLMNHKHDLMHKACGWMLREVGKRGGAQELRDYLDRYATKMPRTMLRYAIERFPEEERLFYLNLKK